MKEGCQAHKQIKIEPEGNENKAKYKKKVSESIFRGRKEDTAIMKGVPEAMKNKQSESKKDLLWSIFINIKILQRILPFAYWPWNYDYPQVILESLCQRY